MSAGGTRPASRRAVLALGAGALVAVAGCTGGQETPVAASGATAEVRDAAAAEAGYEHVETTDRTVEATLTATLEGDVQVDAREDVDATVPVARYRRETDDGPAAFAVAASPSVQVVENPPESRDPLSTLSTAELVAFVQSSYGEPSDLREGDARPAEMLGAETDLVTHRGTAARDGRAVEVAVRVARAEDAGDVVTAVAVHPATVEEGDRVAALLGALTH